MAKYIWTQNEDELLLEKYKDCTAKELSKTIDKPVAEIHRRVHKLGLSKPLEMWTKEEEENLIELYKYLSIPEISKILKRDKNSIKSKAGRLGICKEKHYLSTSEDSRLYNILVGMNGRCNNKNSYQYKYYGELGIRVCNEWNFEKTSVKEACENFFTWSKNNGYNENLTIDRIDNYIEERGYSPENCRWITRREQSSNQRKPKSSKYVGVSKYLNRQKKVRWLCSITTNKKQITIGYFKNERDAAAAYNQYIIDNNLDKELNIIEDNTQ